MYGARIDVPTEEFAELFLPCGGESDPLIIRPLVSTIRDLDNAVEDGNWPRTPRLWLQLDDLTDSLRISGGGPVRELTELRLYERHERLLRTNVPRSRKMLRSILYLKSADINLYRRFIAEQRGCCVQPDVYSVLRTVDVLRELFDDILDVQEDLTRPNLNFLILAKQLFENPEAVVRHELRLLLSQALRALKRIRTTRTAGTCHELQGILLSEHKSIEACVAGQVQRLNCGLRPWGMADRKVG